MEQLKSPFISGHHDDRQSNGGDESRTDGQGAAAAVGKRKYRRHPKVQTLFFGVEMLRQYLAKSSSKLRSTMTMRPQDHHLPTSSSRTVSVIIHTPNEMSLIGSGIRDELKSQNLTFTTIAKRVGERWQDLPAEEKEPYESQASAAKEKYHGDMAEYKTTKAYREYQQYLAEFKAKHASDSGMSRLSQPLR